MIAAAIRRDRRGLNELAAELRAGHESLLQHPPAHGLQDEKHRAQIDGHHAVPFLFRHVEHGLQTDDAGVVEQHVEPAPAPVGLVDHTLDVLASRDVGPHRQLLELGGHLLDAGVEVGQHQPGTVGGEPARARRTDAARRTRDEHRPSIQSAHRRTSRLGVYTEVLADIPEGVSPTTEETTMAFRRRPTRGRRRSGT